MRILRSICGIPEVPVSRFAQVIFHGNKAATCQSVTSPSSSSFMDSISSFEISKLLTSTFSISRAFFALLGKVMKLCCRDHLSLISSERSQLGAMLAHLTKSCAGVQSYALESSTIFGWFMRIARASGAYASITMLCFAQIFLISV